MYRVDGPNKVGSLPAPASATGGGFFEQTSAPGTVVTADWANTITEELINVVSANGSPALDKTDNTQVITAIQALIAAAVSSAAQGVFWAQNTGTVEAIALATWTQRKLDTLHSNSISGGSLAANQVTLPAGTYKVSAQAGALAAASLSGVAHQLRIRDITAGATLVTGIQNAVLNDPNASSPYQARLVGILQGVFVLAASHVIELESFTDGNCTGGGTISVDLLITKIA